MDKVYWNAEYTQKPWAIPLKKKKVKPNWAKNPSIWTGKCFSLLF
ncbi:hypothetical protein P872_21275 [Rhodonellum psychrophilum GCM71 = DSM 17998]|uniref:Uncharacterized protein n=1 Tax=Rhodonellum psychrophilum GCM71 = DSM 17998 TaxID=1123057 RepID=U5BJX5_9BACT|nr:hypothetical protein P872_21275 [Rhodonellum psychrophilum GCM71 = DSM 17998]